MSDRMQVQMAALAVGRAARVDFVEAGRAGRERTLTALMVDGMLTKAHEILPEGDAMRKAIISFATHHGNDWRDVAAMATHGATLEAALEADLGPAPPPPDPPPVREMTSVAAELLPAAPRTAQVFGGAEHHPWMDRRDIND